jgi:hypothetical protein
MSVSRQEIKFTAWVESEIAVDELNSVGKLYNYATMRPIEGVEMRKIEITVTDQEV